jgi:hypothetical protein
MSVNQAAIDEAQEILSQKNSGPSGVLAYMWGNVAATFDEDGKVKSPPKQLNIRTQSRLYYALVETNRSGLTVVAPPGGTQDIIYTVNGKKAFAELAKPKKQIELIAELTGLRVDDMTDELFVAHLIGTERVTNVSLEDAFSAASRETEEEHGFDLDNAHGNSTWKFETDETLFSKRSFQTDPPTLISQKLFVVEVGSFDDTTPRYTAKVETKIPSRMGVDFYEKGTFMSLKELNDSLCDAYDRLNKGALSEVAEHDYRAAQSRFEMMQKIDARIRADHPYRLST